jgi:hypothetical protein
VPAGRSAALSSSSSAIRPRPVAPSRERPALAVSVARIDVVFVHERGWNWFASLSGGGRTGDGSVRMSPTKGLVRMQPRPPTGPRGWMQRTPVLLFGIVLLVLVLLFLIATLTRS